MDLPAPPPWMAGLTSLHHPRAKGLDGQQPSLAACAWVKGKPVFSIDQRKLRTLALRRRCWCCGYPLDGPGYVIVTEPDVTNRYGALHTSGSGPVHRSCALYSAAVCPFLKYGKSRRRVTGRAQRGALSLNGFRNYAVVFPPDPRIFMLFGYYNATETVQLTNRAHVADLYEQAVSADAATGFTTTPRLWWTDSPGDLRRLNAEWTEAWQTLQAWAQTWVLTVADRTYRGHGLSEGDLQFQPLLASQAAQQPGDQGPDD
ncbi:hypothetical protein [Mycobacterium sp. 852002-10029_SCH5224772]|uniref:hypothetical protein n=1 Tax=Mycobacterium sp. 852002-10029_SCH5224772 TaxID=1834083 RepID=UPI0008020DA5|nr:hypothetical protein [Mycobacterium sp. 852002-10029_SCH5224772]OBE98991.1 hypothetical protein A5775_07560 [Mycobacterium sp. 852002-10029_SCH5224772]